MSRRRDREQHRKMVKLFMNRNKLKQILSLFTQMSDVPFLQKFATGEKTILVYQAGKIKKSIRIKPNEVGTIKKHIDDLLVLHSPVKPRNIDDISIEMDRMIETAVPLHKKEEEE